MFASSEWMPLSISAPSAGSFAEVENLERAKGIEPSYAAWEAAVLPLNYARKPLKLFGIPSPLRPQTIEVVWYSKSAIRFFPVFSLSSRGPDHAPP